MIQGGALDVTAALFSDHDWLHLADGCILKGDIRALHNTINGELTEGSFGMRFVSSGAVLHKRLADMRRLHWQDGTGIFFFDNGGRIERAVADFAINTEQHKLRMEVSEASSACGPQYVPHATVDVRLADVVDFIARKR